MPTIRVVATVADTTHRALCAARDEQARCADLVELRLDALTEPVDVARALHGRTKPVIVTCRPKHLGGLFPGSEEERRNILRAAIAGGAEFVDLEWHCGLDDVASVRGGRGIVLSMHEFGGVPADLEARMQAMLALGTEVVKVAVAISRLGDCVRLAHAAAIAKERSVVVIGMGAAGIATRVLPRRFGSCWTYAGSSAPGQITAQAMLDTYRVREVHARTAVYGVAGHPVSHSLSPVMHNAWFAAAGVDAVYLPFDTVSGADLLEFADWLPVAGLSVTAPLKQDMFERLTVRDGVSERAGAVNTVKRTSRGWAAINTDVEGFAAPLAARGLELGACRAAILGAGGAARAAALALGDAGAKVSVHARRLDAAREVAALASGTAFDCWPAPGAWDLLVNATPAGWESDAALFGPACAGAVVYDLVSTPAVTPLLERAARFGCRTIAGLEMLVAQGEAQAEWWTGRRPDAGLMMSAAQAAVAGRGFSPAR
ncbi:MAG: type I 3-dehydroquinate dehydratase [Bacteroidales bacterium]